MGKNAHDICKKKHTKKTYNISITNVIEMGGSIEPYHPSAGRAEESWRAGRGHQGGVIFPSQKSLVEVGRFVVYPSLCFMYFICFFYIPESLVGGRKTGFLKGQESAVPFRHTLLKLKQIG